MFDAFLIWFGDRLFELLAPVFVHAYAWFAGLPSDSTSWADA